MKRAAYSIALTPAGASAEWQARPRKVTLAPYLPLWPITTAIPVGSPTKQPRGITPRSRMRAMSGRTPRQPTSSSYEIARCSGRVSGAAAISGERQADRQESLHVRVPRP